MIPSYSAFLKKGEHFIKTRFKKNLLKSLFSNLCPVRFWKPDRAKAFSYFLNRKHKTLYKFPISSSRE